MSNTVRYERIDQFLDRDFHAEILDWCLGHESCFEAAQVNLVGRPGQHVDARLRVARHALLDDRLRRRMETCLEPAIPELLRALGIPSRDWLREINVSAYGDGAYFGRHSDVDPRRDAVRGRRLSAIYYFYRDPKPFSGGALRIFPILGSGAVEIEPEQNCLIAFPSFVPHEVLPVLSPGGGFADSRFAINFWLHDRSAQ